MKAPHLQRPFLSGNKAPEKMFGHFLGDGVVTFAVVRYFYVLFLKVNKTWISPTSNISSRKGLGHKFQPRWSGH